MRSTVETGESRRKDGWWRPGQFGAGHGPGAAVASQRPETQVAWVRVGQW